MPIDKMLYDDIIYRMESLIIFSNIKNNPVVQKLVEVSGMVATVPQHEGVNKVYYEFVSLLINEAERLGLSGNIFSKYMVYLFLNDENVFTISCEKNLEVKNTGLFEMAKKDFTVLYFFKTLELTNLSENVGYGENITNYVPVVPIERMNVEQVMFAATKDKMIDEIIWCYNNMGVGDLASYATFTVLPDKTLMGVEDSGIPLVVDIVGLEMQKEEIKQNTLKFSKGMAYENMLLWGVSGMGKSSVIRSVVREFFESGVRLIELDRDQLHLIPELVERLCKRGKKFVFFVRKLTYEEFSENDRHLKYILSLSNNKSKNVVLYATSNYTKDSLSGPLAKQCNLLLDRFSLNLYFSPLSKEEYLSIVLILAKKEGLNIPEEFLKQQAMKWEIDDKEKSINSANQFIKYIIRELNKK